MKRRTSVLFVLTAAAVLMFALSASAQTVNCTGVTAWAPNIHVSVGELVTFNGQEFKTIQAHTTLTGWEPPNVPALFSLVGTCGGTGATPTPTKSATPTPTKSATPTPTNSGPTPTPTKAPTASPTPPTNGPGCATPWNATTQYCGGAVVSAGGNNYTAQFCSTGANPTTPGNSGPGGTGDPWFPPVSCMVTPTPVPPPPTPTPTPCVSNCAAAGFIFSPYKDVTVGANFNTGAQQVGGVPVAQAMPNHTLTWAFATGDCTAETWAGISPALEASNVQAFVSAGKDYILSTGGAAGSFTCSSASGLVGFINRYNSSNLVGVDFDIENGSGPVQGLVSSVAGAMSQFPNLRFSFTVAAFGSTSAPDIFNSTGDAVISAIKSAGLGGNWTINPMSFDFGGALPNNCTLVNGVCEMGQSAIATIQATSSQKSVAMGHIEVTLEVPTDDEGEPFTTGDVTTLCNFVRSNGVAGVHFWSLDRDTGFTYARAFPSACGTN